MDGLIGFLRVACGVFALSTVAFLLWGVFRGTRRPSGDSAGPKAGWLAAFTGLLRCDFGYRYRRGRPALETIARHPVYGCDLHPRRVAGFFGVGFHVVEQTRTGEDVFRLHYGRRPAFRRAPPCHERPVFDRPSPDAFGVSRSRARPPDAVSNLDDGVSGRARIGLNPPRVPGRRGAG